MMFNIAHGVFLDACTLFPAPVRDILLSFASDGLFIPLWSADIQDEWISNLLKKRPDLSLSQLKQTETSMNKAFPSALITNYSQFIPTISLPDKNDRHVLAAAWAGNAKVITTFNLKDFPQKLLSQYDIVAIHPDDLLLTILQENQGVALASFEKLVKRLKKPPKTPFEVINSLKKCNLPKFSEALEKILKGNDH